MPTVAGLPEPTKALSGGGEGRRGKPERSTRHTSPGRGGKGEVNCDGNIPPSHIKTLNVQGMRCNLKLHLQFFIKKNLNINIRTIT
jgi:hypothetical protein